MFVVSILCVYFCFCFDFTIGKDNDNDGAMSDCIGLSDGTYTFELSPDGPLINLDCSNEYMILNIDKDSQLIEYFTSFEKWHYAIGGPKKSNPVNWYQWFKPNNNNKNGKFLISPQCDVCLENDQSQVYNEKTSYWMTGNICKLVWHNPSVGSCEMDPDTYECYDCSLCTSTSSAGICSPSKMSQTATDYSVVGRCAVAVQSSDTQIEYKAKNVRICFFVVCCLLFVVFVTIFLCKDNHISCFLFFFFVC